MTIRRQLALALLIILAGCTASGARPGVLPAVPEDRAAKIVFIRPWHAVGSGLTTGIMIDSAVYGLDNGQHVVFDVEPGERLVGIRAWEPSGLFVRIYPTVTINAESGGTYYFRIDSSTISRTTEAAGLELVRRTTSAREAESDQIIQYVDCKNLSANATEAQRARCR